MQHGLRWLRFNIKKAALHRPLPKEEVSRRRQCRKELEVKVLQFISEQSTGY
jgi:hypothetical protein